MAALWVERATAAAAMAAADATVEERQKEEEEEGGGRRRRRRIAFPIFTFGRVTLLSFFRARAHSL